jgi:hypothetical protein
MPPYSPETAPGLLTLHPPALPFDLGLGAQTSGPRVEATIRGRRFVLDPLTGPIEGRPAYALQVSGDDLEMSFACFTPSGSYSVKDDTIKLCDYTVAFTGEPRNYVVNGHPVVLPAGHVYAVFNDGSYHQVR